MPLAADELAQRFKRALLDSGLTREQLAEKAGLSRSVVLREIERGVPRERHPLTLARLALALGQPYDHFGAAPPASATGPGRALIVARLRRGWTIEQLAATSRVSRSTIHGIEHNRHQANHRTWDALRAALGSDLVLD